MVNQNARLALVAAAAGFLVSSCVPGVPEAGRLQAIYALPSESFETLSLGRGQTLGELLYRAIGANEQESLLLAFSQHASPRRIRQGTEITLRYTRDNHQLRGVDVALTPDETVRLSRDLVGWDSKLVETPIYIDTLFVGGEIETVLWNAVVGNSALQNLTLEDRNTLIDRLDRVFQWQVDFSRQIRVGDTYRFAFEREVRPDGSMRSGQLLAAELVNRGTPFYAILFDPNGDGEGSYFDLEGESVRRAFLLRPLTYRRISSLFTNSRYHPILKTWRSHRGVDYAANAGTDVMATSDGVVIHRGLDGAYGNSIEIRHSNGFMTRYAHLRGFRSGIAVGSRVRQGDIIGYVGMTGLATGNHLHYEMLRGGRHMDPLSVDLPAGDPVPSEDRVRWVQDMSVRVAFLERIPGSDPIRLTATSVEQLNEEQKQAQGGGSP